MINLGLMSNLVIEHSLYPSISMLIQRCGGVVTNIRMEPTYNHQSVQLTIETSLPEMICRWNLFEIAPADPYVLRYKTMIAITILIENLFADIVSRIDPSLPMGPCAFAYNSFNRKTEFSIHYFC